MPNVVSGLRKVESMLGGFLGLPRVGEEIGLEDGVGRVLGIGDRYLPAPLTVDVVPKIFDLVQCSRGGNHITPFASSRRHWTWRPVFLQQHASEVLCPSAILERLFAQRSYSRPSRLGLLRPAADHYEVVGPPL